MGVPDSSWPNPHNRSIDFDAVAHHSVEHRVGAFLWPSPRQGTIGNCGCLVLGVQ